MVVHKKQTKQNMADRYIQLRRLLFPTPTTIRFIQIMGGKVHVFKRIAGKDGLKLAWVVSLGAQLKTERYRRNVRVGNYYVDFGNDVGAAIDIEMQSYYMDIVADMDREIYLTDRGWRILRLKAPRIWNDPKRVQQDVTKFITK